MNLKDIKHKIKVDQESAVTKLLGPKKGEDDPYEKPAIILHPPLWHKTDDDRIASASDRLQGVADISQSLYARLLKQVKRLNFHGFLDASLNQRICCKCLKAVCVQEGCCRWQSIWICYGCWDKMVVTEMQYPSKDEDMALAIAQPKFTRQVDGHLGGVGE